MGLLVSKYGVGPTEEKVRGVLEANRPSTPTEVRSFLGMVGFSARFIPNLATVAEPLRAISRKGVPFVWSSEQETSFQELKKQLASAPVLAYFDKDALLNCQRLLIWRSLKSWDISKPEIVMRKRSR